MHILKVSKWNKTDSNSKIMSLTQLLIKQEINKTLVNLLHRPISLSTTTAYSYGGLVWLVSLNRSLQEIVQDLGHGIVGKVISGILILVALIYSLNHDVPSKLRIEIS
jgi:hypothetical protein